MSTGIIVTPSRAVICFNSLKKKKVCVVRFEVRVTKKSCV